MPSSPLTDLELEQELEQEQDSASTESARTPVERLRDMPLWKKVGWLIVTLSGIAAIIATPTAITADRAELQLWEGGGKEEITGRDLSVFTLPRKKCEEKPRCQLKQSSALQTKCIANCKRKRMKRRKCKRLACSTDETCMEKADEKGSFECTTRSSSECTINPSSLEWTKILADDGAAYDEFGLSVAIDRDTIVVGAPYDDDEGDYSGSVYVFVRSGDKWIQQDKLVPDDGAADDFFGWSVAFDDDTIVVGAPEDNDNGNDSGSAYVFVRSGGKWVQQDKLVPDDGAANDEFGYSVAVDNDTIVVGAYLDDDKGDLSGSAYIFVRSGDKWVQQDKLLPDDGATGDWFGLSVAIDDDTIVVGAYRDDDKGSASGSAYVFVRSGGKWAQQAKLVPDDGEANDYFGRSVAVDRDTIVVGAWGDDDKGDASGAAYIFVRSGGKWAQQAKLVPDDRMDDGRFGWSVSVHGDTIVVGAYWDNDNGDDSGSAYLFTRTGNSWLQKSKLVPDDGMADDEFGVSVAISGGTAVVGARYNDDSGSDSGSAYIVELC